MQKKGFSVSVFPEKPFLLVGAKGFEPSTPWSQTKCATKLRYAPTMKAIHFLQQSHCSTPPNDKQEEGEH